MILNEMLGISRGYISLHLILCCYFDMTVMTVLLIRLMMVSMSSRGETTALASLSEYAEEIKHHSIKQIFNLPGVPNLDRESCWLFKCHGNKPHNLNSWFSIVILEAIRVFEQPSCENGRRSSLEAAFSYFLRPVWGFPPG